MVAFENPVQKLGVYWISWSIRLCRILTGIPQLSSLVGTIGGGFYNDVAPPQVDRYGLSLILRGLVIIPRAKEGYIDLTTYLFESWLRIVEELLMFIC
jgi:hypothetical protein